MDVAHLREMWRCNGSWRARRRLLAVALSASILGAAVSARASEPEVTPAELETARTLFHLTWFERADDLFAEILTREPDHALAQYRRQLEAGFNAQPDS